MNFTGKNLRVVRRAADFLLDELQNQRVTCPDVEAFADDLAVIEEEILQVQNLLARIDRALAKERA